MGTCTAACKSNSNCTNSDYAGTPSASGLCVMGSDMMGVCTSCSDTVACSSGTFATTTNAQVGLCTSGVCSFSATCTSNSDCTQSNFCATSGTTENPVYTCAACSDTAGMSCTSNGTFAQGDAKKTGTCTSGVCTYVQSCTDNSNCETSNLCVNSVCQDACTDDASCMLGTANSDDWEGTCNTANGQCSFEETGLSGGAIAGIVIGSVVFVLLVVVGIYFCTKQSGETDSSKAVAYETLHENH